jgi:hypothetical protein
VTLVNAETGEVIEPPPFTQDEAQRWKANFEAVTERWVELRIEGFQRRAWLALGYDSWEDLCDSLELPRLERDDRRAAVGAMRAAGMSTRAIGAAVGASDGTVRNDLNATAQDYAVEQPEKVTGLDGKDRPATRPEPDPEIEVELSAEAAGRIRRAAFEADWAKAMSKLANVPADITPEEVGPLLGEDQWTSYGIVATTLRWWLGEMDKQRQPGLRIVEDQS